MNSAMITDEILMLADKLSKELDTLILNTKSYVDTFDTASFYLFSEAERIKKSCKAEHQKFLREIIPLIEYFSESQNRASRLTLNADMAMDTELTVTANRIFEGCELIEKELRIYVNSSEKVLSSVPFSAPLLMESAKRLLSVFIEQSHMLQSIENEQKKQSGDF